MKNIFIIILVILYLQAKAQTANDISVSANYHYGYMIPEYKNFIYTINENIQSFSFSIAKQTIGKTQWEQSYNYPKFGLSFFYSTLGNDDIYGKEIAIYPYFHVNYLTYNKFSMYQQIGVGLNYVTKKFNTENNLQNIAIGSHVNIHFNTKLGFQYRLFQKTLFIGGISFDHFSNANTNEPNIGINFITAYGGINYLIGKQNEKIKTPKVPHIKSNSIEFILNAGGKRTRALTSDFFFTTSFTTEFTRKYFEKFHFGIGCDFFYDSSVKTEMKSNTDSFKKSNYFQSGIHATQTIVYDKLSLSLQEGFYLGLKEKINNNIMYNKAIIKFQLSKQLSANLSMKTHLHILDYPEIGIGFKL